MLLLIDRDQCLYVFASVADAEAHLETIDIEDDEYEFCDESGQRYIGEVLKPVGKFTSGEFRIVPRGVRDSDLPLSFVARAKYYSSHLRSLKTLEDARLYLSRSKS
jgi:hypothetical protein